MQYAAMGYTDPPDRRGVALIMTAADQPGENGFAERLTRTFLTQAEFDR